MAYNLVALWRCRYLRRREAQQQEKRSWQEFFDLVLQIFSIEGQSFSVKQVTECPKEAPAGRSYWVMENF